VGKKAQANSTTFPLQSPNWWLWDRAILHVRAQLDRDVGDFALADAMNRRDVAIKIEAIDRRADPPKQVSEVLGDEFFRDFRVQPGFGKLLVVARTQNLRLPRDHVLYAWGPHLLRLWPTVAAGSGDGAASTTASTSQSLVRQPSGPKTARGWQDHVLREIVRAAYAQRPVPAASALARSCTEHLGVTPDVSKINEFLRKVRAGQ
jgi:hypothetical protein